MLEISFPEFSVQAHTKPSRPGCWNILDVEILNNSGLKIGSYERNYPSLFKTFYPFEQNGKWYALYSPDYTCTRIMSLPDCKDLGGEEPNGNGFCPTGYYVPKFKTHNFTFEGKQDSYNIYDFDEDDDCKENDDPNIPYQYTNFGFVCGCEWGDDSSWKIEYLDLSDATHGYLKRDNRFGYIEKPRDIKDLKSCIRLTDNLKYVTIVCEKIFNIQTGKECE